MDRGRRREDQEFGGKGLAEGNRAATEPQRPTALQKCQPGVVRSFVWSHPLRHGVDKKCGLKEPRNPRLEKRCCAVDAIPIPVRYLQTRRVVGRNLRAPRQRLFRLTKSETSARFTKILEHRRCQLVVRTRSPQLVRNLNETENRISRMRGR